jgi:hypothetical protein
MPADIYRLIVDKMHLDQTVRCHVICSFRGALRRTVEIVTFLRKRLFHKMFHVETFRGPGRRGAISRKDF